MGIKTRGYTDEDRKKGRTASAGQRGAYPPEGEYEVLRIDDARYVEVGRGEKLQLELILDVKGEEVTRRWSGWVDNNAQMANFVEAVAQPNDPEELEPDDVIGRGGFRAVVKHEPDRNGGRIWANVAYLLPPASAGRGGGRRDERRDDRRDERGRDDDRGARREERGGRDRRDDRGRDDRRDGGNRDRDRSGARTYGRYGRGNDQSDDLPF